MEHFDFDGSLYRQASAHQRKWGHKIIEELKIKESDWILDLGCGDGSLTKEFTRYLKTGKVIGLDASPGMLEKANEFSSPKLQFILKDVDSLRYENQFDLIFSNAALHWVFDHKRLLENCYKALKPGGKIRFNFASEGNCKTLYTVIRQTIREDVFSPCFSGFRWPWYMPSLEEYRLLLSQTPFLNISVWTEDTSRFFQSQDEITKWIDQPCLVPFLQAITNETEKKNFRDVVVKRMLKQSLQPDHTYFETFIRLNVKAEKPS